MNIDEMGTNSASVYSSRYRTVPATDQQRAAVDRIPYSEPRAKVKLADLMIYSIKNKQKPIAERSQ